MWKTKSRFEFSKLVAVASALSSFILSAIIVHCTYKGIPCDNLTHITEVAWGATAVSNTFYFNKAKAENVIKNIFRLYKGLPKELQSSTDISQLISTLIQ